MTLLILALVAFGLVHLIPAVPRAKNRAIAELGRGYGPVYGVLSFILLVLVLAAHRATAVQPAYDVAEFSTVANFALSLLAMLLLSVAMFRGSWRNRIASPAGLAVGIWSLGHLLANGNTRDVALFAGLAAIAGLHVFLRSRLVDWQPVETRSGHNVLSVLFGLALFGIVVQAHVLIAGVPVINLAAFKQ